MAMDEYGRLQINLLGKPELWLDGRQLTNFSTAKTEALLYYLAATRQIHSRETLAGLLWGEMPEAKARRNLTKSLTVLRRLLEPFLLIEPQRVGFDPEAAFNLDVTLLETACTEPAETAVSPPDLIAAAINGYRGDFLDGFFVKDAPAFEAWLLTQRERLREMALGTLASLLDQAVSRKMYALGLEYGRRLLEIDPWRESVHRQLMLLLARQGQYAAALTQYEQCRQLLADELGLDPMPATTALYQRIQDARHKHAYSLPHEPTPLVGRQQELNHIQELLSHPDCRLLTITGLGGMGKTRLAIAAAHQANQATALLFLNGVAFVSLASVAAATAVPLTLATALEIPLSSAATPRHALLHFLQNREMLLVLDNLEQLTGAADLLLELLQTCPDLKLLLTSRVPLNLASEWRLDLEGLPFPPPDENDVAALQAVASVSLFVRSASQMNSQFRLTAANAADVRQLCRLVAGIPLALQLAAAWLPAMSITAILAELEHDLDILATDMQDIPPRQRSMRAVFESAWHHLSSAERAALAALSLCRGGFTQAAARQIAGANPFLLRRLINRALIHQQTETRYDMHPLTQQFAREQLGTLGNEETAAAAHGRFFLSWLIEQAPALQGMMPQAAISAIKTELDNLHQAWQWALPTKQTDLLLDSLTALTIFYDILGLLQEGEALADTAISHLQEPANPQAERLLCHALTTKSHFLADQGQYEAAANTLDMAQALSGRVQDQELEADIYHINGRILTGTGKYNAAEQQMQQALSIYRHLQNERKLAKSLTDLGWINILNSDVDAALPPLQEALTLERKAGHKWGEAFVLGNLSVVYSLKGEMETALATQQKVLAAYEALGDLLNTERAENNYGMSLLGVGRYRQALPHIQRAVELARQLGAQSSLTNALDSLGTAYLACGEYEKARVCLAEALDSALEIGYVYMDYSVRAVLARLFNRTGHLTQAAEHLQQLHSLANQLENAIYIARSLAEQAYLTNAQGNLEEATELMAQAIDILRQNPAPLDIPFFLLQQAGYLFQQQRPIAALPLVQEALETAQHLRHEPLQMRAAALAATLFLAQGDVEQAQSFATAAQALLPQLEPYPDVLEGLLHLTHYWLATENYHAAIHGSTLVAKHPASPHSAKLEAQALLDELNHLMSS